MQGMALGALLTVPIATPALAGEPNDPFAAFPLIRHEQMAQLRGGFNVGGLELEFGANVRTLIDNVVRLETIVQLTKAGLISSNRDLAQAAADTRNARSSQLSQVAQDTAGLIKGIVNGAVNGSETSPSNSAATATAGNAQASAAGSGRQLISLDLAGLRNQANRIATQATAAESSAASGASAKPVAVTNPSVSRRGAGAQVDLSGLGEEIQGVVLNDTKGLTASIQEITRNRISNTVINQANGRQIDIEMNIQVDVKNFSRFSESLRNGFLNQRLANQNF